MTSTANPRSRFVPVDGAELCLQAFGDPAQPTVLLVAGAACSMDWWDEELCSRLAAEGRQVIRYDHRDTGRSSCDPPGAPSYDGEALTRDCAALARHLTDNGEGPVHLVGLSMGGGIAQTVALRNPELVASLTLIATSAVGGVETDLPGPTRAVAATFEQEPTPPDWSDREAIVAHLVAGERPFVGSLGFDEERITAVAKRVVARSTDPASADNHWLVIEQEDEAAEPLDVHDLTVPTLVLHGSDDPLFPLPHGEALAAAISGARLEVLPGMGHEYPPPSLWDVVLRQIVGHSAAARRLSH